MYQNLLFFHEDKDFNVIVLQPKRGRKQESRSLKKNIKCYYFTELHIFGNNFLHFLDLNPFYIKKVIKILKKHQIDLIHVDYPYGINILRFLTKVPVSYNAYNVEAIYWRHVGKYYYKIPFFLRTIYAKFIYFLEKNAIKYVKNINAFTDIDKRNFIRIYNIPKEKIIVSSTGYKREIAKNPLKREVARNKLKIDKEKFVVAFHGSYLINDANIEAINVIKTKIAPQIKDNKILFLIAGKIPPFKNLKNLKFVGFVKDLRIFLYAADIAIIPIFRGSGTRIKMIDYLSAKIPMIVTKQAVKGLNFQNKIHGYIVNEKRPIKELIEKILELKSNSAKIDEFKINITTLLKDEYDWDKINNILKEKYREILKNSNHYKY